MSDPRGRQVYVDSNVFIYAVEGLPATAAAAKELIKFLLLQRGLMVSSEITLAEVLAPSKGRGAWPVQAKRRVDLDLLIWSGSVNLVPVTRDILVRTADLRRVASLKLLDAIHLVSAMNAKCKFFVTGDAHFKKLPTGMKLVKPDEDGARNLMRVLA